MTRSDTIRGNTVFRIFFPHIGYSFKIMSEFRSTVESILNFSDTFVLKDQTFVVSNERNKLYLIAKSTPVMIEEKATD